MRHYPPRPFYGNRAMSHDPLDDDPLLDEFRALEREVRQRECDHPAVMEISEMGGPWRRMCAKCGKIDPPTPPCSP